MTVPIQDKERTVQNMFSSIAPFYDLNNTLLSFGLHHYWKRLAVQKARIRKGARALDLCSGTADIAILLAREVGEQGSVVGLDLNRAMLSFGRRKIKKLGLSGCISLWEGNAENLPFKDSEFAAATVGFGIRNVVGYPSGLW